jgi:hypothetical protein
MKIHRDSHKTHNHVNTAPHLFYIYLYVLSREDRTNFNGYLKGNVPEWKYYFTI